MAGDRNVVVGGSLPGTDIPAQLLENGSLEWQLEDEVIAGNECTWSFKISF